MWYTVQSDIMLYCQYIVYWCNAFIVKKGQIIWYLKKGIDLITMDYI